MSRANHDKRRRRAPTVEEALGIAYLLTERAETGEESRLPYVYLWTQEGHMGVAGLSVKGGGPQFACTARLLVLEVQPAVAVVAVESWFLDLDPRAPLDPIVRAWLAKRARGEDVPLTALPPDYLGEQLILAGEDREGHMADRLYRIWPRLGEEGKRRFERKRIAAQQHSIFHPLFVLAAAARAGVSEQEALANLRREARNAGLLPAHRKGDG